MIVIMNKILTVFLLTFSIASTTSGQASNDVSPFVMISNEPIRNTNLTSKHNSTASSIQTDLVQTLSHCEPQQYILLSQFGLQPEDIQNVSSSMPKLHGLIQSAAQAVVIPHVSGVIDCMSMATSALRRRCIGTRQLYYDARLEDVEEFSGDEEERREVLRRTDDYIAFHLSALQRAGQSYVLVFTASTELQMGQRRPEDRQSGPKEKQWELLRDVGLAALFALLVGFLAVRVYL
ncbi:hypothetical protein D0867_02943 [Hortaea werneckii]|uniref:Protein BIG1 n=1 Tax=Hortaea werneckii TaxID=91943 RepID=A0A3M7BDJ0_HORWE|nr:hypothetical protein D0867_02943 [Hortaea werneckii]RMY37883.1 hypothetical protein D0866_02978 [Hortaea werneckii]